MQTKNKRIGWLAKKSVHYILLGIYNVTYGLYIRKRYRLTLSPDSDFLPKGPYLLLANHNNNFDGLFLQCIIPRPIHFVVTDTVFKNRMLSALLSLVGYIPKKKSVSDMQAVRQIVKTVQKGGIVGIFPEGGRSWDGQTEPISPSTYRLAKLLGVPVVTARIMGSYLSEPRWADNKRYGRVEIALKTRLQPERLSAMSLDEIGRSIADALFHNESAWQQRKMIAYRGKAQAEGFERLLFLCPECGRVGAIRSQGERIWCAECGAAYYLDPYGYIHASKGYLPAGNLVDLNRWQLEKLRQSLCLQNGQDVVLSDEGASLWTTESLRAPLRLVEKGRLALTLSQMIIGGLRFDVGAVYGNNVFFQSELAFRHKTCDYRIRFDDKHISAYKWHNALELIKEQMKEA